MVDYTHPFDNDGRLRQLNGKSNGAWHSAFGMQRWEDIGAQQSEMLYPWVVENIIPECESILGYGHTGSGKTFGFFDMALHIAQGMKFNGYNVQGGLVIYHAVEAGKGFAKRKLAYAKHYEIDPLQPLPFVLLTQKVNLFASDEGAQQLISEINHIKGMYEEPLRLLFLDTMSAATPGMNENVSQDVSPVRNRVDMIRDAVGASVIVVHHMAKGGTTPRGHSSLSADYETTIEFETTLDRDPIHGLPVHKATVQKQREGQAGISWSFVCKAIQVGTNMWGNPETSCVALPIDGPVREKSEKGALKLYSEKCKAVFGCLMKAIKDHGQPAPQELQLPLGTMVVHGTRWWEKYKEIDEFDSPDDTPEKEEWRAKDAIKHHGMKLLNLGIIGRSKPWAWWTGKAIQGLPETYGDPFHKPVPRPFTETEVEF